MNEIDLHGVKHENVQSMLDRFLWDNMQRKSTYVSIITGNSNEMKKIVNEIITEYGYKTEQSLTNSGVLNVNLIV